MAAPVIVPELQFCDADGNPYAGGSITTYVPGTTTPKATWLDPGEAAFNTNPVILDAAGRSLMYGDGDYRLILKDALGNTIWDIVATTIVSAAMAPVVSAATIADALTLLGVDAAIAVEAAARAAADSTEQTARIAADTTEATTRAADDTTETNARIAADTNLQTQITALAGAGAPTFYWGLASAGSGHVRVTYPTPFSTFGACTASIVGSAYTAICIEVQGDNTGADIYISQPTNIPAVGNVYWIAIGT